MSQMPATNRQVPDNAILDHFNKQKYLGNGYKFVMPITTSGTGEVVHVLLTNPVVSGAAFPVQKGLFVDLRKISGLTAASTNVLRAYLDPTITSAGTPATAIKLRVASPNTSVAALSSDPTISANGTLVECLAVGPFGSVVGSELIILDPGHSLLLTVQDITSANVCVELSWFEI